MSANGLDVLRRIADDRQRRVAEMQTRTPGWTLRGRLGPIRPCGRLERALRRGGAAGPIRLLCEVKRASPSKGPLREAVDPVALAGLYTAGGAAAISLVTEPDHFRGDPEWVDAVRPRTPLPILMKDFVVDPYQLLDAAARGADAVLLIAALLSGTLLQRLVSDARLLGLDALVEVHDEGELRAAIKAGATLVGINNRDLRTFEVDLDTSHRLLPAVPPLVTAVAESGLARPEDVARLRSTRCDAVLIGEAFMTSADPAATLAALRAAAAG
jgi:indole-3-glycerol phosphate synthase